MRASHQSLSREFGRSGSDLESLAACPTKSIEGWRGCRSGRSRAVLLSCSRTAAHGLIDVTLLGLDIDDLRGRRHAFFVALVRPFLRVLNDAQGHRQCLVDRCVLDPRLRNMNKA